MELAIRYRFVFRKVGGTFSTDVYLNREGDLFLWCLSEHSDGVRNLSAGDVAESSPDRSLQDERFKPDSALRGDIPEGRLLIAVLKGSRERNKEPDRAIVVSKTFEKAARDMKCFLFNAVLLDEQLQARRSERVPVLLLQTFDPHLDEGVVPELATNSSTDVRADLEVDADHAGRHRLHLSDEAEDGQVAWHQTTFSSRSNAHSFGVVGLCHGPSSKRGLVGETTCLPHTQRIACSVSRQWGQAAKADPVKVMPQRHFQCPMTLIL